jgi:hypothetical protein
MFRRTGHGSSSNAGRPRIETVERRILFVGSASGTVFNDLDGDFVQDGGETGIGGRVVYVDADNDQFFDSGERSTITASSGAWGLSNLPDGTHIIRQVILGGSRQTGPADGAGHEITIAGGTIGGLNFGVAPTLDKGSIFGTVFYDEDLDGVQDPSESGLSGRTVFLDANNNGVHDTGEGITTTDSNGNYNFPSLTPFTYRVRQVLPAGWIQTFPTTAFHSVTVTSGTTAQPFNFGTRFGNPDAPVTFVSGSVYDDNDLNLSRGPSEPGIGSVRVFIDANNSGTLDSGETSVLSDSAGVYVFNNPPTGTLRIRVILPAGLRQVSPEEAHLFTITTGQQIVGQDFGLTRRGIVSGVAYEDANSNGRLDLGERGLQRLRVFLDFNNNGRFDSGELARLTNGNGEFVFENVRPGTHTIMGVVREGLRESNNRLIIKVKNAGEVVNANVGQTRRPLLSGQLFNDLDRNGRFNGGEPGIPGWRVFADANGNGIWDDGEQSVLSGLDGSWSIRTLLAGTHQIRVERPAGWEPASFSDIVISVTMSPAELKGGVNIGSRVVQA